MAGYTIDFGPAQDATKQLQTILEELGAEIQKLGSEQENLLSDANWRGPNKSMFTSQFEAYKTAAMNLHANGEEHLAALQGMISAYASAEQG